MKTCNDCRWATNDANDAEVIVCIKHLMSPYPKRKRDMKACIQFRKKQ